jgi:hypothetical protein
MISNSFIQASAGTTVIPANPRRVAVFVSWDGVVSALAMSALLQFRQPGGTVVFVHPVVTKAADVALVTPSPMAGMPIVISFEDIGPFIYSELALVSTACTMSLVEVIGEDRRAGLSG